MKLREAINSHKGDRVKIGSSSSFVFCGLVDDGITKNLEEIAQYEMQRKLKSYELRTRKSRAAFIHLWAHKMNDGLRKLRLQSNQEKWTPAEHEAKVAEYIKEFEARKQEDKERRESGQAAREHLASWVDFLDRRVKEIYPSLEGGFIILIEGHEVGEYWTYEEYERKWGHEEADIL